MYGGREREQSKRERESKLVKSKTLTIKLAVLRK